MTTQHTGLPAELDSAVTESTLRQVLVTLGHSTNETLQQLENQRGEDDASFIFWDSPSPHVLPQIVAMRLNPKRLRRARVELGYSQEQFAKAIRNAGRRLGVPNRCTKRNVQKWESGEVRMPLESFHSPLEAVTKLPFVVLCTPELPPDDHDVARELSFLVTDLNDLVHRVVGIVNYLER